jgi:hypothetical protein
VVVNTIYCPACGQDVPCPPGQKIPPAHKAKRKGLGGICYGSRRGQTGFLPGPEKGQDPGTRREKEAKEKPSPANQTAATKPPPASEKAAVKPPPANEKAGGKLPTQLGNATSAGAHHALPASAGVTYRTTACSERVKTAEGHEVTLKLLRVGIDVLTDVDYEVTLSCDHGKQVLGRIEDHKAAVAAYAACLNGIAAWDEPEDEWGRKARAAVRAAKHSARSKSKKPRKKRRRRGSGSVWTISAGLPSLGKRR